ncbi:hypothetical protein XSR1_60067 [Xenorhabdus szentirmaii DSM 16338]|uniref:Uncharacterized protein n=1 Tax=Xenorhabdus szentirmaii DSM 16338 TaxID=1427518 RepID=W1J6C7_9GAMM|nr:hypothetical protein XSR1_60067 [Xenorhabdus szentirmaii DSM 16338]
MKKSQNTFWPNKKGDLIQPLTLLSSDLNKYLMASSFKLRKQPEVRHAFCY